MLQKKSTQRFHRSTVHEGFCHLKISKIFFTHWHFSSCKFFSLDTNQPGAAVSGTHFKRPICRSWKAVLTSWQLCALALWTPHWGPKLINIQQIQTRHTVSRSIAPFQSIVSYNNRVTKKCKAILQNSSGRFPRVQHLWRQALLISWKRAAVNFTCLWIPSSSEDSQELKEALLPNSERGGVGWDSAACTPLLLLSPLYSCTSAKQHTHTQT